MRVKFYEEPTDDLFAETLNNGLANGTLRVSDSEYAESFDLDIDDGKQLVTPFANHESDHYLDSILGPVTSTPHPAKRVAQPAKARKQIKIKVQVHDGNGSRYVSISNSESFVDILERIAQLLKRPNQSVSLGYEAPWSAKIRTKKLVAYITNDKDLEEFWSEYFGYLDGQAKKKGGNGTVSGIVFLNMLDSMVPQVRCLRRVQICC